LLLGLGVLCGRSLWGEPPPAPLALGPGTTLERDIGLGDAHDLPLPLSSGTYLYLEIRPTGVQIAGSLLDPSGRAVATLEGDEGSGNKKLLAWITSASGDYRLRVTTQGTYAVQGHYELRVRVLRPAEPVDATRVRASRKLAESRRLRSGPVDKAERAAREALALWQSAQDGEGEVEALTQIGSIYAGKEDYRQAFYWHQQALKRAREIGYANGEAWALGNIGNCYLQQENYPDAADFSLQSFQLWRRIGNPSEEAFNLLRLGNIYRNSGFLDKALESFRAAFDLDKRSRDVTEQAHALSGVGAVLLDEGNLAEAYKSWETALELSRAVNDKDSELVLENNLGAAYHRFGQLQKAVGLFTKLIDAGPRNPGLVLCNLGAIHLELGDLERALDSYRRAAEIYRQAKSPRQVDALVGIGTTLQRMGNPRDALKEYQEARKLSPTPSWALFHYEGWALIALSKPAEGLQSFQKALSIARTSQRASEASTLLAIGVAYRALGKLGEANDHFTQAIQLGNEIDYPSVVSPALLQRAMLRRDQGRLEEARADTERALEIIESTRRNIAGQQIRTGYLASKQTYYEVYVDLLMRMDDLHPGEGYKALALEASERARARGLLDLLAEGRIDVGEGISAGMKEKEGRIAVELARIQQELSSGKPAPTRAEELSGQLKLLHERQEQLDWDIREQNPRYAQVRYPTTLKMEEIRSGLGEDTALLEYAIGKERSTLFVLTRGKLSSYPLAGAGAIAKQVGILRRALEKESLQTRKDYLDSAHQLYRMLVAPAFDDGALAGKANLLIVPDRDLYYIPFETLLTRTATAGSYTEMPYLLRQYAISYVPSASVLAGLRQPRALPAKDSRLLIAFAPFAPAVGRTAGSGGPAGKPANVTRRDGGQSFAELPASRQEISRIGDLYSGSALEFFGTDATEENVKQNPAVATARRLHFATHAQLDERYPEYSSLILARSPDSQEDGYLRAQEIFSLKLSADLVVLSACQTALGKEVTGEGLIGLTRAFFYAGVPSLVVSLWNVVDVHTPDFMLDFYEEMDSRHDKSRALQKAKLDLISKSRYAHPSFWAPFILIGEPK
jgi:CHAT domain-containing protein/tetratricopeptide (TPR) repeat protein